MQQPQELSYRRFAAYAALAVGIALVPIVLWQLGWVLILGFAAILIAILLHVVAEPLKRWTPLPHWADLLIAGSIVLALLGVGVWIFGTQLSTEFNDVMKRVQAGLHQLQDLLHNNPTGQFVLSRLSGADVSISGILGIHLTGLDDLSPRAVRRRSLQAGRMSAVSRRLGRNSLWALAHNKVLVTNRSMRDSKLQDPVEQHPSAT